MQTQLSHGQAMQQLETLASQRTALETEISVRKRIVHQARQLLEEHLDGDKQDIQKVITKCDRGRAANAILREKQADLEALETDFTELFNYVLGLSVP